MNVTLRYLNPAGNITAVVLTPVERSQRAGLARAIMAEGRAEQVGFMEEPQMGGACRLEMMGGEFCGNAVRSYGLLYALAQGRAQQVPVEISGAEAPVPVTADPAAGTAYADMPLPLELRQLEVLGKRYPLVMCQGICHLLALEQGPDPAFLEAARPKLNALGQEAWGLMFLEGQQLTPAVYVTGTDSLVWESSCGSGSVACGWYLARQPGGGESYRFREPGGEIQVTVSRRNGVMTGCTMGGPVTVGPQECFAWEN